MKPKSPPVKLDLKAAAFELLRHDGVEIQYAFEEGVHRLGFHFDDWAARRVSDVDRIDPGRKIQGEDKVALWKLVSGLVGPEDGYVDKLRLVAYARLRDTLEEKFPELGQEKHKIIVNAVMTGRFKNKGWKDFRTSWDVGTLGEYMKFRDMPPEALAINSRTDIERYVGGQMNAMTLSCRRLVKKFIFQKCYYTDYFADAKQIAAIDCSFKYTASSYAFVTAMKKFGISGLHLELPEVFFKQAGRKIRDRKFAGWLEKSKSQLEDLYDSVITLSPEECRRLKSWSDVERHSAAWHQAQIDAEVSTKSASRFRSLKNVPDKLESRGYEFMLLESERAMAAEGRSMHHCIGSYAAYVRSGGYLAFHIAGKGEEASVGYRRAANLTQLDQIRGRNNSSVSREIEEAAWALGARLPAPPAKARRKAVGADAQLI